MKALTLQKFLEEVSNKFFCVVFIKADGSTTRRQACAKIPKRLLVGGKRTTDPKEVVVFLDLALAKDRKKTPTTNPIRAFRWDRVKELHFNKKVITAEDLDYA